MSDFHSMFYWIPCDSSDVNEAFMSIGIETV